MIVVCAIFRVQRTAKRNTKSDRHGDAHGRAREIRLGQIMESITHARALGQWARGGAGRGGGGGGVGGHGERTSSDVVVGRRPCVRCDERERNERWHLWPADGQKANWRMCGAPCARRVRLFVRPPPPPAATLTNTAVSVGGGNSVMWVVSRRLVSFVCVRVRARYRVLSWRHVDGRTVTCRRLPARPTTKRDIGDDGRTGAARSSHAPTPSPTRHCRIAGTTTTLAKRIRVIWLAARQIQ